MSKLFWSTFWGIVGAIAATAYSDYILYMHVSKLEAAMTFIAKQQSRMLICSQKLTFSNNVGPDKILITCGDPQK